MGRKIPAKKHRGVKNPLEQQARRERSLKSKINAPPKDPDEQPVPRSLTRLFAFQNKSIRNTKPINERKQLSNKNDETRSKGKNPVCELRRLAGESGRSFSLRINSAVRALHAGAGAGAGAAGASYPQDMEAEDLKGERMAAQRARRRRRRREDTPVAPTALVSRAERRAAAERSRRDAADADRAELRYERVPFGQVAHAPPDIQFKGAAHTPGAQRPGRRDLLLTPLLSPSGVAVAAGVQAARRDAAVAAYRALNADRRRSHHHAANRPLNKLHT